MQTHPSLYDPVTGKDLKDDEQQVEDTEHQDYRNAPDGHNSPSPLFKVDPGL
jgi:hypothetical protein